MSDERPIPHVIRRGGFLSGATPLDDLLIRELPSGVPLKAKITKPRRSVEQNRFYWVLLGLIAENLDQDVSPETLHEWLKLRLGVTKELRLRSGEVVTVTGSTAFDKMEHHEFTAFMDRVKTLIETQLIPRSDSEAFVREAQLMLADNRVAA